MIGILLTFVGLILLVIADALKKKLSHQYDSISVAIVMLSWAVPLTSVYALYQENPIFIWDTLLWCVPLSSVLYCVAELAFITGLRSSQLSLILPLRVIGPMVALPFGMIAFGEFPAMLSLFGTAVIILGCYLLYLPECDFNHFFSPFLAIAKNRSAKLILLSAAVFPVIVALQRVGSEASSPMSYFALTMAGELGLFLLLRGRDVPLGSILSSWTATCMAILWTVGFALVMIAANYTYVLYITVVMQLSPLLSIPLACMLFGEQTTKRIWPTVLMVFGVILLVIGAK